MWCRALTLYLRQSLARMLTNRYERCWKPWLFALDGNAMLNDEKKLLTLPRAWIGCPGLSEWFVWTV
jgi:hypothetical protein